MEDLKLMNKLLEKDAPKMPIYRYRRSGVARASSIVTATRLDNERDEFVEQLYADYLIDERRDAAAGKIRIGVFVALIFALVGGPLLGAGLGLGITIANRMILPGWMDDSDDRQNFSFDSITVLDAGERDAAPIGIPELVEFVKPSVVTITAHRQVFGVFGGATSVSAGSGVIMYQTHSRIYIATNAHVIERAVSVSISIEGSDPIPAHPMRRDDDADLAVFYIYRADLFAAGITGVRMATFGDSGQLRIGEGVLAVGNAMGEGTSVTDGIISAKHREITIAGRTLYVLQTNAAINHGNSGGPLVNMQGEVIGINTAKFSERVAEGMGYAIPSNVAMPILEELMRLSNEPIPMAGISFQSGGRHAVVGSVTPDAPAALAGILRGDILLAIDGAEIRSSEHAISVIRGHFVGDMVIMTILRDDREIDFEVILIRHSDPTF